MQFWSISENTNVRNRGLFGSDVYRDVLECELEIASARYFYLKGRALNVVPKYSKEAEDLLSKAIKLDPKLVGAWNELGECYWKNNKINEAINCFKGALKQVGNRIKSPQTIMKSLGYFRAKTKYL